MPLFPTIPWSAVPSFSYLGAVSTNLTTFLLGVFQEMSVIPDMFTTAVLTSVSVSTCPKTQAKIYLVTEYSQLP